MSAPRVRYADPPQFVLNYPTCSACDVDLDHDGDGWECPKCRTVWGTDANDGDSGELWSEWSGEDFDDDTPATSHDDGWKVAWIEHAYQPWVTDSGLDMRRCRKCYSPPALHVGGAA